MLNSISPALNTNTSNGQAYLSSATGDANSSYTIVAESPTDTELFTLTNDNGSETFTCSPVGKGSCSAGSTW